MAREYGIKIEDKLKKRLFTVLIEIDQILLPMIDEKERHMAEEIARMNVIKARKAKKHLVDDWEDKSLINLSDESDQDAKAHENRPSDIPSSKYAQFQLEQAYA